MSSSLFAKPQSTNSNSVLASTFAPTKVPVKGRSEIQTSRDKKSIGSTTSNSPSKSPRRLNKGLPKVNEKNKNTVYEDESY